MSIFKIKIRPGNLINTFIAIIIVRLLMDPHKNCQWNFYIHDNNHDQDINRDCNDVIVCYASRASKVAMGIVNLSPSKSSVTTTWQPNLELR